MITLHGRANSSNVQKVRWALDELELAYDLVERGGEAGGLDDPEFQALTPFGKVPVMVENGASYFESNSILRHLGRSEAGAPFWPRDPVPLGRAEAMMDWALSAFWPVVRPPFIAVAREGQLRSSDEVGAQVAACAGPLMTLEAILSERPWLGGTEFTFADIPAAVALTRLVWLVGRQALPPQTGDWLDACAERPGYEGNVYVEE